MMSIKFEDKSVIGLDSARGCRLIENAIAEKMQELSSNALDDINAMTATNSSAEPSILDPAEFKKAMDQLMAINQIDQEYLITLLATMGFMVLVNEYTEKPIVMLPKSYNAAILACQERQDK